MLTVMAIIAILAAITFGLSRGVSAQQANSRARTDLSQIALALEAYRQYYGDYPILTGTERTHIGGLLGGRRNPNNSSSIITSPSDFFRSFLDIDRMTTRGGNENILVDPWGSDYEYFYNPNNPNWEPLGYILYSRGPSRNHQEPTPVGVMDRSAEQNLDNFFPND